MLEKKENNTKPVFMKDEFRTTRAELDALLGPANQQSAGGDKKSDDPNTQKILLIGDVSRAFLDADAVRKPPCQVHANMPDAIEVAAKNNFDVIGVVMSGSSAKLSSALKALRAGNRNAKIILLAQMYEEPAVIQLLGSASNGQSVADDYLICPIHFSSLVSRLSYLVKPQEQQDISQDVQDMKIRELEKLATEDELTGLKNRRYIWEFSRQIIEHAKKENGRVTLLIFDIDNFKHYNDVYGHSAGDEVLEQAAVLMQRCCRSHDVVGRIGGDEFAVIFWDEAKRKPLQTKRLTAESAEDAEKEIKNKSSAVSANSAVKKLPLKEETERRSAAAEHPKEPIFIAKRFRTELEKTELGLLGPEGKGVLTISGGLASFPNDGSTIRQLFDQADTALLEAKRSGKNRIYLVGGNNSV